MNQRREHERAPGGLGGLVRWAAQRAPAALAPRLEEEWLADLAERRGWVSRLGFALGCCWATRAIARDPAFAALATAVAAVPVAGGLWDGARPLRRLSRRASTLGLVACLHLGVFYAFLSGLQVHFDPVKSDPLQNASPPETHPRDLPRLLPTRPTIGRVQFDPPRINPGLPPVEFERDDANHGGVQPAPPTILDQSLPPPHVATRVPGGPGIGFPNPDDYYPALARHLEEQGVATVKVCVDAHGRLTGNPVTLESTGSPRLDEGALKLARAGSGHFRATTEDGRPVDSCYPVRIRFQLRN